jgi:hypothetical protein
MGPMGIDSNEDDALVDTKTGVAKNGRDKSCHCCMRCNITGHTRDVCTYRRIPLKEKYMIDIAPEDRDDAVEIGVDSDGVAQTEGGVETPRMDLETEAENPWSIQSPEAKRQKA